MNAHFTPSLKFVFESFPAFLQPPKTLMLTGEYNFSYTNIYEDSNIDPRQSI